MTFLSLPARIGGDQAARHFARPRFANLYGLLVRPVHVARKSDPPSRVPPFVERLWMPAYAVRLRTTSSKGERSVWTTVEAVCGEVSLLESVGELSPLDTGEDCFPPGIGEPEAVELARKGLLRYVMTRRGQFDKPVTDEVEEIRLYHFPVWVYYYRRRRKYLDLKVLDGCTGKASGAKMRVAVINALVAAKKSRQDIPVPFPHSQP